MRERQTGERYRPSWVIGDCKVSINNNVGAPGDHNTEAAFLSSDPCRLQSPGGSRTVHTIRWCSTSSMFNHKNTPSSFLKNNNVDHRSSLAKRPDGWKNVTQDVGGEMKSSCSGEDEERVGGYQSVSVSTRWAWDDIFTTINTTQAEGNYCEKKLHIQQIWWLLCHVMCALCLDVHKVNQKLARSVAMNFKLG